MTVDSFSDAKGIASESEYVADAAQLEDRPSDTLTEKEQRHTIRKIDLRVSVATGIMFCISIMDRSNLGAASIAG